MSSFKRRGYFQPVRKHDNSELRILIWINNDRELNATLNFDS